MEVCQVDETNDTLSFWTEFFRKAGIVAADLDNYAISFVNHRIKKNMLSDLNKEYLCEMGITAMGDIIAILRQAKAVMSKTLPPVAQATQPTSTASSSKAETPLEKLEKLIALNQQSPLSKRSSSGTRRSTPASRMVGHYLANEPGARLMSDSTQQLTSDVARQLDYESGNWKNSVFDRLGSNGAFAQNASAHSRLGLPDKSTNLQVTVAKTPLNSPATDLREVLKRPATTTCHDSGDSDSDDSECQYAGVLKKSTVPRKKCKKSASRRSFKGSPVSPIYTEGIFGDSAKQKSISAKHRLGNKNSVHQTV